MGEIHEEVVQRAQARVGKVLCGQYRLDAVLGVGGMAAVYAASRRDGSRVAIKMLHTALSTEADLRKRFLREGYVANTIKHSGVAKVLDDNTGEDGSIFFVMDLIVGASAATIAEWRGGRVDADVVVGISHQLLGIVEAAHNNGVIHRDIKPDNICLTHEGTVKLLDFGVARTRDAGMATQEGTTIGTPAYMAPEQALGKIKEVDSASDLYSVGAVMFNMLSGRCVHDGDNANELLILAATHRARSLASVVSDVPKPIVDVVDRALMFEKAKRWSSAASMREALWKASIESFGCPPTNGLALASALDGIEEVDYASTVDEDEWPTLSLDRSEAEKDLSVFKKGTKTKRGVGVVSSSYARIKLAQRTSQQDATHLSPLPETSTRKPLRKSEMLAAQKAVLNGGLQTAVATRHLQALPQPIQPPMPKTLQPRTSQPIQKPTQQAQNPGRALVDQSAQITTRLPPTNASPDRAIRESEMTTLVKLPPKTILRTTLALSYSALRALSRSLDRHPVLWLGTITAIITALGITLAMTPSTRSAKAGPTTSTNAEGKINRTPSATAPPSSNTDPAARQMIPLASSSATPFGSTTLATPSASNGGAVDVYSLPSVSSSKR